MSSTPARCAICNEESDFETNDDAYARITFSGNGSTICNHCVYDCFPDQVRLIAEKKAEQLPPRQQVIVRQMVLMIMQQHYPESQRPEWKGLATLAIATINLCPDSVRARMRLPRAA